MLMCTDPFPELDRLADQVFGTTTHPAVMPMDKVEIAHHGRAQAIRS